MTLLNNPRHRPARATTRALDIDALDAIGAGVLSQPRSARRFGVLLFWAAVACLIIARVALFDPSATRAVGSFADQIAPVFGTR